MILLSSNVYAQNFGGAFNTDSPKYAYQIFTNTNQLPSPLGASDVTVQLALQTLATNGGGGSSEWTDGGSALYPNEIADSVGIGTTSPSELLHVAGDARVDDIMYASRVTVGLSESVDVSIIFDGDSGVDGELRWDIAADKASWQSVVHFLNDDADEYVADDPGDLFFDGNAWTSRGAFESNDRIAAVNILAALKSDDPANGQVPKWNSNGTITWENDNNSGGATGTDTHVGFFDGDDNIAGDAGMVFNKTTDALTVGSVSTSPTATPTIEFYGSNTVDGDLNAHIQMKCTNIYSGTEDCDLYWLQQQAGTFTEFMRAEPTSGITVKNVFTVELSGSEALEVAASGVSVVNRHINTYNDVYSSSWDGNTDVPTKDAVYDKIETISAGGGRTNYTLPIYSAKLTGSYVTHTPAGCSTTASAESATIDGGSGPWKLLIDATTDEAAVWQFVMPSNYSSAPTLDIHFAMASGEANEVEFEGAIMCYTPTTDTANIDTASFANCAIGTATTVSATAGEVYSQSITLTDDSCAAGDDVFIWISTDADDATNDDASGDREVINVEFGYTGS